MSVTTRPTTLRLARRQRRLRQSAGIRALVRETRLSPEMFIYPLFVCEGEGVRREVPSMPGVYQLSVDEAVQETEAARGDGVPAVLLFGLPEHKDDVGSAAYDADAPVQSAIRAIKQASPDTVVITDVCLCEYTTHGHCGIVQGEDIVNDPTVAQLVRAALSHAEAGANIVAPSDMMDGRVGAIREALDERGFTQTAVMSVRGEVLVGVLRPVPRRSRLGAEVRRPADAPDGSGERRGGAARGRTGHRGGGRHRDGEAGPHVSRRHRAREGRVRLSDRGLPRERRVQHAEGGGPQRLDRRAPRDDGSPDGHPPRRRRHDHHVLRAGGSKGLE